ncbi:MAG: molybdopterin-dependent oxidoreductase [Rhodobacteraceae bacterium]|nr:molybdopterin-dependent oxidoreductase [Paracoccaceae bacterium]
MKFRNYLIAVISAFFLAMPVSGFAQAILTVSTHSTSQSYSLDDILAMPQTTVTTSNHYVEGSTVFQGPSLRYVLEQTDIKEDAMLRMTALNDFSVDVPASDAFKYDVILAVHQNGEKMSVRDKGPIWIIYPMDDHPELSDSLYSDRLIWQLSSISVK